MLRTLAKLRNALVGTALAIETPLAVKSVEYADPSAAPRASEPPNGLSSSTPIPTRRRARRSRQTGCVALPCLYPRPRPRKHSRRA
jgi:hypothetical protein